MNANDRFYLLWTDYLEGDLDEHEMDELREWIASDPRLLEWATEQYQAHRLLGLAVSENPLRQDEFVRDTLNRLPADKDRFVRGVMMDATDRGSHPRPDNPIRSIPWKVFDGWGERFRILPRGAWVAIAGAIFGIVGYSFWNQERFLVVDQRLQGDSVHRDQAVQQSHVRLASVSNAKFFGQLSPAVDSLLVAKQDYVLTDGVVKIQFPRGASAIVEGPAVFRVLSDKSIAIDAGLCSIHAPQDSEGTGSKGSSTEGFVVETPVTRIVDRGTRFTVSVSETSETEVQLIEGAADIYRHRSNQFRPSLRSSTLLTDDPRFELRMVSQQAHRFLNDPDLTNRSTNFQPETFRSRLPDRVISFDATNAADQGVERLTHVTVQRDGHPIRYPARQLIPAKLIAFKSSAGADPNGHLVGAPSDKQSSESFQVALSDFALNTGVINPGGNRTPLASNPVMNATEDPKNLNTPGFAVRFQTPVINSRGPDVVFFELQSLLNPPDGDAFHVSPLQFATGLRSITVEKFDLTLMSPEALKLTGFNLYRFNQSIDSMSQLQDEAFQRTSVRLNFRVLAVGIDLSDLGYADGEEVEGLFFQDAQDNDQLVDPVFIGGLPSTLNPQGT